MDRGADPDSVPAKDASTRHSCYELDPFVNFVRVLLVS